MSSIAPDVRTGPPELDSDEPRVTHIVKRGPDGEHAESLVMRARIEGFPVEALCGARFVPSRDPQKFPVCQRCIDIAKAHTVGRN